MPEIEKVQLRLPSRLKRRVDLHRAMTQVSNNDFGIQAIERALDEAGVPQPEEVEKISRPRTA